MFEGIKQELRAVQYGDAAIRRRWFFICVIGIFSLIAIGWIAYGIWRGSFGTDMGAGIQNAKSSWENFLNDVRNAAGK